MPAAISASSAQLGYIAKVQGFSLKTFLLTIKTGETYSDSRAPAYAHTSFGYLNSTELFYVCRYQSFLVAQLSSFVLYWHQ
jgi:hypothetical protein